MLYSVRHSLNPPQALYIYKSWAIHHIYLPQSGSVHCPHHPSPALDAEARHTNPHFYIKFIPVKLLRLYTLSTFSQLNSSIPYHLMCHQARFISSWPSTLRALCNLIHQCELHFPLILTYTKEIIFDKK